MLPKIIFRYSWLYDNKIQEWTKNKPEENFPYKQIQDYIKKIEKLWRKDEKRILSELSKVTKLKWQEKEIICYLVHRIRPFSDPITIPIKKYPSYFIDVLTHELIHRLFTQEINIHKSKKLWVHFHKKYSNESKLTRIHIPLHSIHKHIYLKIFNKSRLDRDIQRGSKHNDYRLSWEIVEKEGYKNIIKEFRKSLRGGVNG